MHDYKECKYCIYRPCGKAGNEAKYCLVRFLIFEREQERKRKKAGE